MADLLDRLGPGLLDATLAAAALSGLVAMAMVHCRQPARRRAWARAGLLAILALPPMAMLNPVPRLDVRPRIRAILPTSPEGPGSRASARGLDPAAPMPPICQGPAHRGPVRTVGRWLVVLDLTIVTMGLGRLFLGLWASALLVRRARAASIEAMELLDRLPFDGRRRPGLAISDRVNRPGLLGLIRPVILLPAGYDRPDSADRLRLAILHELAHVESADHLFGAVAALAQAFWSFLPPVRWIGARLRLDQEFLADHRAADRFGESSLYASTLVDLASARASGAGSSTAMPAPRAAFGASALFQRVLMILKCPFAIEPRPPDWWRWSIASAVVAATLAASCLTIGGLAGRSEEPSAEPARSFRLARLDIGPRGRDDAAFDLRVRLPDRFSLSMEILADPADLPSVEVLGHPLGRPIADGPASGDRLWHRVEVRRGDGVETLRVDGVENATRPVKLAGWLTIRPAPGHPGRIRDLGLSW